MNDTGTSQFENITKHWKQENIRYTFTKPLRKQIAIDFSTSFFDIAGCPEYREFFYLN